jgi:hypothetical protein
MEHAKAPRKHLLVALATGWILVLILALVIPISWIVDLAMICASLMIAVLVLTFGSPTLLRRQSKPQTSSLLAGGALVLAPILFVIVGHAVRMAVLAHGARAGTPLARRIMAFVQENDVPPQSLADLGPDAEDLAETGITACPRFSYETSKAGVELPDRPVRRSTWSLTLPCDLLIPINVEIFYGQLEPGIPCSSSSECSEGWIFRRP